MNKEMRPDSLRAFERSSILPKFRVVGRNIYCGDYKVHTDRKPLTLELFKIFLEEPLRPHAREYLIYRIYHIEIEACRSEEYRRTVVNNIVKLVSRARVQIEEATKGTVFDQIQWFSYDKVTAKWRFMSINPEYIIEYEKAMLWISHKGLGDAGSSLHSY